MDTVLANMADNPSILQLVSGWAIPSVNAGGEVSIAQLALQGQSFFVASGDAGAYPPSPSAYFGSANGTDLRQQPAVTVVGGTVLTLASGAYGSETGWSLANGPYLMGAVAGTSPYAAGTAPSNRTHPVLPIELSEPRDGRKRRVIHPYRNYPDVSTVAENVNIYYGDPGAGQSDWPYPVVGTDIPAVIWAAFLALANQFATVNARQPVGLTGGFGALDPKRDAGGERRANFKTSRAGRTRRAIRRARPGPRRGVVQRDDRLRFRHRPGLAEVRARADSERRETCTRPASCASGNVWNAAKIWQACAPAGRRRAMGAGHGENGCGGTMNCGVCCTTPESCCEKTGGDLGEH